jgi:hypothetical protein
MSEAERRKALRDAIESVIGMHSYVLVYDSTPIDVELDDNLGNSTDYAEPIHQTTYTSIGLLTHALDAYRNLTGMERA